MEKINQNWKRAQANIPFTEAVVLLDMLMITFVLKIAQ